MYPTVGQPHAYNLSSLHLTTRHTDSGQEYHRTRDKFITVREIDVLYIEACHVSYNYPLCSGTEKGSRVVIIGSLSWSLKPYEPPNGPRCKR